MEAVSQSKAASAAAPEAPVSARYVPSLPTLWPSMLMARPRATPPFPFEAAAVRFYYLGRNAVFTLARVLQLDRGEVLLPAYHHGVEVEALVEAGAQVRFYRVGPRMQVDPADVERAITPRTAAVYLIHYLGFPGPAAALSQLCRERGLPLIEDCALALLSRDGDRPLGTFGQAAIFSLYKTLPLPHGGALALGSSLPHGLPAPRPPPSVSTFSHLMSSLLQNAELRGGAAGRALRAAVRAAGRGAVQASGVSRVATGTQHFERENADLGMSPLARRIALAQDFPAIIERRRRNFFFLLGQLREVAPPIFAQLPPGVCPLFYPLQVEDKGAVAARLARRGIETVDFWRQGHPACPAGEFPDAAELRRKVLEVPIHQDLEPAAMARVAQAVRAAVREAK